MKKLLFISWFLFFIICSGFAQTGWQWLNPKPTGMHLNYVKFINSNTGIIVGHGGTILRTTNGGLNWIRIQTNITNTLMAVSFSNQTNGIAVGEEGLILKTTNAGLNWYQCYDSSYSTAFTKNVSYVDNETVYASDYSYYMKKSTNGGLNWVLITDFTPSSIFFINSLTGYRAYGSNNGGDIEITTNGGINWTYQTAPYSYWVMPYFIRFTNTNLGLITSWSGFIYYTNNGGQNWYDRSISRPSPYSIYSAQMINDNVGYAASDTGIVFKTTNSGINWTVQNTGTQYHLVSLDFIDANTGVAVGNFGSIVRTTNGGINWSLISAGYTENLKAIYFVNPSTGFAAGSNSRTLKTTNGGTNWAQFNTGYFINYFGIKFLNINTGFMVGDAGNVLRTTNSGVNWTQCNSSSTYWLIDIDFWDNQNGYAVGSNQTILKTTNGGVNWFLVFNTTNSSQNFKVKCVSPNTAYVSGSYIYKTTNTGVNWNVVSPSSTYNMGFWDMSFINEYTGYVATTNLSAGNNNILKTTNGGLNWETQFPGYYEYNVYQFLSITMSDVNTGYTCGDRGYIYKTTNGGTNWNLEFKCREPFYLYNQSVRFNRIFAFDTSNMYIVGNNGTILKKGTGESSGINGHKNILPNIFHLEQNYPNPFNPSTVIGYSLSVNGFVTLKVYDILGREIATLVNEFQKAGTYETQFPNNKYTNNQLPSGIYFYKLTLADLLGRTGDPDKPGQVFSETKKLVLLK